MKIAEDQKSIEKPIKDPSKKTKTFTSLNKIP